MRPSHAQPELGRIYESNNRGVAVFLTADEETALSLLVVGLATEFLLLAVILVIWPQIRGGSLLDYTLQDWLTTGGYVLFYIAMMILAGPAIGSLSVSRKLTFLICRLVGY